MRGDFLDKLQSKRLSYRRFKETDLEDLFNILGDPVVCQYLPGSEVYTKEQVGKWLNYFIKSFNADKQHYIYAVTQKESDKVIGYCGCAYIDEYKCDEIKYFLNKDFFGQGLATEMAFRMKQLAKDVGLKHVVGLSDIHNIGSQKILEKIGYKYVENVSLWGSMLKYYELDL